MPVINYQGTKLSVDQKNEFIERFTSIAVEITKTPANFFTVIIQEFDDENLGAGGKTVAQIKAELNG